MFEYKDIALKEWSLSAMQLTFDGQEITTEQMVATANQMVAMLYEQGIVVRVKGQSNEKIS